MVNETLAKKLGSKLKHLLIEKKMSQRELAKHLDCTPTYISNLVRGVQVLPTEALFKIASLLEVGISYFEVREEYLEEKEVFSREELIELKTKVDHLWEYADEEVKEKYLKEG